MNPIYGNHLGIVINDQDPEHRSRLQVFIPYLSNTLYDGWNKDGITNEKDISFKTFEDGIFSAPIKEKLKNILPWAEAAVPSFGGATSAPLNTTIGKAFTSFVNGVAATGNAVGGALIAGAAAIANQTTTPLYASNNADPNTINARATSANSGQLPNNLNEINPNMLKFLGTIAKGESGLSYNEAYSNALNQQSNNTNVANAMANGADLAQAQAEFGDYGYYQNNNSQNKIASQLGITGSLTNGSASEQTIAMAQYIQKQYPTQYEQIINGDFNNAINTPATPTIGNSPVSLSNVWFGINNQGGGSAGVESTDPNSFVSAVQKADSNPTAPPQEISQSKPVQRQFSPTTIPPSTGAKGFYSKPMVGAKVWVFFYGGDIQRPVYFATAVEGNGSIVAYQPITS
jgi:hypothetical protein